MPDDDVRTVTGEVVDGRGGAVRPSGIAGSGGSDEPFGDAFRVSTCRLSGPPGGVGLWLGIGLVVLGAYLVLAAIFPAVSAAGSAVVVATGLALIAAGATRRRGAWAIYLGAPVAAIGAAQLGYALGVLPGSGWTTLALGVACLGLAAWRAASRGGWRALAVIGGIFAAIGGIQAIGGVLPGFPTLGELVLPALFVGAGAIVLARSTRRR